MTIVSDAEHAAPPVYLDATPTSFQRWANDHPLNPAAAAPAGGGEGEEEEQQQEEGEEAETVSAR